MSRKECQTETTELRKIYLADRTFNGGFSSIRVFQREELGATALPGSEPFSKLVMKRILRMDEFIDYKTKKFKFVEDPTKNPEENQEKLNQLNNDILALIGGQIDAYLKEDKAESIEELKSKAGKNFHQKIISYLERSLIEFYPKLKKQALKNIRDEIVIYEAISKKEKENLKLDTQPSHTFTCKEPPVPKYFGCFTHQEGKEKLPFMIQENMSGDLAAKEFLKTFRSLNKVRQFETFVLLAKNLGVIHACGIFLCDIKPDNIMRDDKNNLKFVDFGLSKISSSSRCDQGTVVFMSPEVALGYRKGEVDSDDFKADVFSLVVTFLSLLSDSSYAYSYLTEMHEMVKNKKFKEYQVEFEQEGEIMTFASHIQEDLSPFFITLFNDDEVEADKVQNEELQEKFNSKISIVFENALNLDYKARSNLEEFIKGLEEIILMMRIRSFYNLSYYYIRMDLANSNEPSKEKTAEARNKFFLIAKADLEAIKETKGQDILTVEFVKRNILNYIEKNKLEERGDLKTSEPFNHYLTYLKERDLLI